MLTFRARPGAIAACCVILGAAWLPLPLPLPAQADPHAGHVAPPAVGRHEAAILIDSADSTLPAGSADAEARLASSPRHGEWVMIPTGTAGDSVRAWVVYPERSTQAPVVVVVHEIFGLTPWIRAVADQLAADGFIAIAPDHLTNELTPNTTDSTDAERARVAIRRLQPAEVQRQIDAAARYGMALPAALSTYGVVGFCWGGAASFAHAAHAPQLGASVVYYGSSPGAEQIANVRAPVLGLYAEDDARVNSTVPAADSALRARGRIFEPHYFEGAGHGFLRGQHEREGANLAAAREAWPLTVAWFRKHLEE